MGNFGYYLKEGFGGLGRRGNGTAGAVFTVILALLVIGVLMLLVHNLQLTVEEARAEIEVEAYITGDLTAGELASIEEGIIALRGVAAATYVSKEAALVELRAMLGEDEYLLGEVEENPLPASYRVTIAPDHHSDEQLKTLSEQVAALPGVTRVSYGREWIESLSEIVEFATLIGLIIGGVLVLAGILVVGNAVALGVYLRREEIGVLKIVGATGGFIRRPFVIQGFLVGLLGGLLGVGVLYGLYTFLAPMVGATAFLPLEWWLSLIGLGAAVGLIGSFFSAIKHVHAAA